jgi:hypothetical protein
VIRAALENRGALIQVRDLDEACRIANRIAPEHLELSLADAEAWVDKIRPRRRNLHRPLHLGVARRLLRGTRTTSCRLPAARASRRRSASMTSRSGPA